MTPDAYCQNKAAQSGSSFYYSFLFLPPLKQRAIMALYAFCREVDDVVDEATDLGVAAKTLDWWRKEVHLLFHGHATHPTLLALQPHLDVCKIKQHDLMTVIDGMEMDLNQSRYLDEAGLRLYCHRVAGIVGVLSASIFGYEDELTLKYAETLGQALQRTNIIRDVGEDARRGRIYLPISALQSHNVPAAQILKCEYSQSFVNLMKEQADIAREDYAKAWAYLPKIDRRAQRPGLIMGELYRTLLDEIEGSHFMVLNQRISLTPIRKLWIAWKTWLRN
jgi:15-cis-phytoene synthase